MRMEDETESENVEDRRGGGGVGRASGVGIGTVVIALIASYFLGIDPRTLIGVAETVQNAHPPAQQNQPIDPASDPQHAFKVEVAKVLHKTENTWSAVFQQQGGQYRKPKLVLFAGATSTACGQGQSAMGLSTVRGTKRSIWTWNFLGRCNGAFMRAVTSRALM